MMTKHVRDMTPAERQRMCARAYLAEARRRGGGGDAFAATLLRWAKNARVRAHQFKPAQPDLFTEAA